MNIERYLDELPPDFPESVINLFDALRNYRLYVYELAHGSQETSMFAGDIEPNEAMAKHLEKVDVLLAEIKKWELCPNLKP
jgi:hypothetical protein